MLHRRPKLNLIDGPSPKVVLPACLSYALQPIADVHTGTVYAYEALVRGTDEAGFASIDAYFQHAHNSGSLYRTELALFELALAAFRRLPARAGLKIFLNIDGRVFAEPGFDPANFAAVADRMGVPRDSLCLELSEKFGVLGSRSPAQTVRSVRAEGLRIAVDDFGQGFSELKLLYETTPEYVKIDRFFISRIAVSPRKRLFVSTVVNLAHVLGARVVAEGVETAEEFDTCREIGCDYAQGWFVDRPLRSPADAPSSYPHVAARLRPNPQADRDLIDACLNRLDAIAIDADPAEVTARFQADPSHSVLPVVDGGGEPLGIVRERELRQLRPGEPLRAYVARAPVVDINGSVEQLLDAAASVRRSDGLLVTNGSRYEGVLTPAGLLRIMNERRSTAESGVNHLTRLPGSDAVAAKSEEAATATANARAICFFDFNHFKAFNDTYGYGRGDRVIILFAEVLRRNFVRDHFFLGHSGGDHFFTFTAVETAEAVRRHAEAVLAEFRAEVVSFYEPADRERGYIIVQDAKGTELAHPTVTASAAVLSLPVGVPGPDPEALQLLAAESVRAAKLERGSIICRTVG